jgi:transaldolase
MRGLERRVAEGKPVDEIHSVASFFVSRVDTMVDRELEAKINASSDPAERTRLRGLVGQAAVANVKVAYRAFKQAYGSQRWEALDAQDAQLQRPLWASTSTKNPAYPDSLYISEIVGPHTVNTIPENALMAFADHGVVRGCTVEEDVEAAQRVLEQLSDTGINLQDIGERRLIEEGACLFVDSFDRLLTGLQKKCEAAPAL